jgi:hypothetical protein
LRLVDPHQRYETWFVEKQNDTFTFGAQDKAKKASYRMSAEIERTTDLRKVPEERILDIKVELSLREVLGIPKKVVHDSIVHLVKRKRRSTELKPEKPVEVQTIYLEYMAMGDELAESHYSRLHWARATMKILLHHDGTNGDEDVGQRLSVCTSKEPGWVSLDLVPNNVSEP